MSWRELLPLGLLPAIVVALIAPCLPPGICRGDFGDLQLAAATLGIAHPPGYPIYASLLYPFSVIPDVDPVFGVTVACLASGLVALGLGMLILIRLGASGWIAAAAMAILVPTARVRLNLIAPEVYAPTLSFLAGAAYLMVRFAALDRSRDLILAAGLFGVACFSRPPIVLAAPFFLGAWWISEHRARALWARRWRRLGLLVVAALAPGVYSALYVALRDRPSTGYNYIDHYNADPSELPPVNDGLDARVRRVWWLMSGAQFREYVRLPGLIAADGGASDAAAGTARPWPRVVRKLRWLRNEIAPMSNAMLALWFIAGAYGAAVMLRRLPAVALVLLGLIGQSFVFVCIYEVHGQSADILPLMLAGMILVGMAADRVLPTFPRVRRPGVALLFVVSMAWMVLESLPPRLCNPAFVNGASYAEEADLGRLPYRAVILSMWDESVLLRHAQILVEDRPDITIVTASPPRWPALTDRFSGRPVFLSRRAQNMESTHTLVQTGALWQVAPVGRESPGLDHNEEKRE